MREDRLVAKNWIVVDILCGLILVLMLQPLFVLAIDLDLRYHISTLPISVQTGLFELHPLPFGQQMISLQACTASMSLVEKSDYKGCVSSDLPSAHLT